MPYIFNLHNVIYDVLCASFPCASLVRHPSQHSGKKDTFLPQYEGWTRSSAHSQSGRGRMYVYRVTPARVFLLRVM